MYYFDCVSAVWGVWYPFGWVYLSFFMARGVGGFLCFWVWGLGVVGCACGGFGLFFFLRIAWEGGGGVSFSSFDFHSCGSCSLQTAVCLCVSFVSKGSHPYMCTIGLVFPS